jgi:hypothetical protein
METYHSTSHNSSIETVVESVSTMGFRGPGTVEFRGPLLQNTYINLLNDNKH